MKKTLLFFALASCLNVFSQNVGIGTNAPTSKLDINGALSLREGPVLTLANGGASGGVNDNISLPDMAAGGKAKHQFQGNCLSPNILCVQRSFRDHNSRMKLL